MRPLLLAKLAKLMLVSHMRRRSWWSHSIYIFECDQQMGQLPSRAQAVQETSTSACQTLVANLSKLCKSAQAKMDLDLDDDDAFHLQKKGKKIADDRKAINKELDQVKIMSYVFIFHDFRELVFGIFAYKE